MDLEDFDSGSDCKGFEKAAFLLFNILLANIISFKDWSLKRLKNTMLSAGPQLLSKLDFS